jgi:hypothetical protein
MIRRQLYKKFQNTWFHLLARSSSGSLKQFYLSLSLWERAGRGLVVASIVIYFLTMQMQETFPEMFSSICMVKDLVEVEGDSPFPSVPFPKGRGGIQ